MGSRHKHYTLWYRFLIENRIRNRYYNRCTDPLCFYGCSVLTERGAHIRVRGSTNTRVSSEGGRGSSVRTPQAARPEHEDRVQMFHSGQAQQ